jgi:DNA gyrase/topoisomerase IV subunit A
MIPEGKWRDAGTPLKKIAGDAAANEKIIRIYPVADMENLPKGSLLFFTKEGMIKKSA